jgi:hypothetical protein
LCLLVKSKVLRDDDEFSGELSPADDSGDFVTLPL